MTYGVNPGLIPANPLCFQKASKDKYGSRCARRAKEALGDYCQRQHEENEQRLIEWQLHTMTRLAEAATARWAGVDVKKKIWTIPGKRMKKRRMHIISLTDQAVALLKTMTPYSGLREYEFPADRGPRNHCNNQTANKAL